MTEVELAQHFVNYLSDYDLYFEVDYHGCVDIVAIHNRISIAVEVKTAFSFKVLEQALNNQRWFNYSYAAVPTFNDWGLQRRLCQDYGIGLLLYSQHYGVEERIAPRLQRRSNKQLLLRLHDWNKRSLPGAPSGVGQKISAFQVTRQNLYNYVKHHPGCTIKQAMSGIAHHYSTDKIAATNIYSWLYQGVIKEVEYHRGKLYIKQTFARSI